MNYWWILYLIDGFLFVTLGIEVIYILILSIASLFNQHSEITKAKKQNRFIILIPAYKQDKVVMQTINSVLGQTYPQRLFDIVVISDHEEEMTNMRIAQAPVTLLTPDFEESSKAKSMQFAILNLPQFKIYDAVLVLDAGNIIEPEYLEQVNDAFETAGTKVIQTHRLSKNRDTSVARLDTIFEEINNSIFRRGHNALGLSAALNGSGMVYDFEWFKINVMKCRTAGEDKELEAMLLRDGIYIDYFDNIHLYDEKTREISSFNYQRGRWAATQLHAAISNARYFFPSILSHRYDFAVKIFQWWLAPRTILIGILLIMSSVLPFIYFSLAVKWWIAGAVLMFAFSIATPDHLVDEKWNRDFLYAPLFILWGMFNIISVMVIETKTRIRSAKESINSVIPRKN